MCKIVVRPVGCWVGLELMRDDLVLNSYSFNGFDKNAFSNMIIRLKLKSINTILVLIKLHVIYEKLKAGKKYLLPVMQLDEPRKTF